MAILNLVDNSIDKKKPCAAVFIDLSKAFDTIDHIFIYFYLKKLHRYGFRGTTLQLLKSYLSNRS